MNNEKEIFINDTDADELTLEKKQPSKSNVLYEDVSRRSKDTKHFRLPNGNFMAVLYDHPVHRLDAATGKYVDIVPEMNENDGDFEAVTDRFRVRLPKSEGKENFVSLEKGGRSISWKYMPRQANRRKRSAVAISRSQRATPWDIENLPSARYEGIDVNTDIQYDIADDGVKESIILSRCPDGKIFTFKLKLTGLVPRLSEDKKTVFLLRDDDDIGAAAPEMKIPPAFMVDDNDAYCDDIHYEIHKTEEGVFLDLVVESDWLTAPERAYPVVVDPRVEVAGYGTSVMQMVEVCSNGTTLPASNKSTSRRVGVDASGIHRLYIEFRLPQLADGYKITQAGLLLYQKSYVNDTGKLEDYIVAPVSDAAGNSVDSAFFDWSNVQGLQIGETIDMLWGYSRRPSEPINIDLTKTISDWYADDSSFHGIVVKKRNEKCYCCDNTVQDTYLEFYSLYEAYSRRPKLYIEYASADMYADHQKYQTFENGRAGTGSINLFTGKLSYAHGDVMAEGVKLPLSVSHLYRHEYVKESENELNKYGKGWRLSVEQRLEVINYHGITAVYTNAQGKRHYFMSDAVNEKGEIVDDAGLGLTYKEECNCICGRRTTYALTDEKGNKMTFDADGRLLQLIDVNGNVSCLTYSDGKLKKVVDGNQNSALLVYNEQNQLSRIIDAEGRSIWYRYDTSGNLSYIIYPAADNAYNYEGNLMTFFTYDSEHRLIGVKDYSGISYTIDYTSDNKVSRLSCKGTKNVAHHQVTDADAQESADSISFEYRTRSTAVVDDRTRIKTVYKFDGNGRELSAYQDRTNVEDTSKIGVSTPTEILGYQSIVDNSGAAKIGKYRALSVSFNHDASDETNLLQNSSFTLHESEYKPVGWYVAGGGEGYSGFDSESYTEGLHSYYFDSNMYYKYLEQTVNLCSCQLSGNILVASAWAKASGSVTAAATSARFRLILEVTYEDGEKEEYVESYDPAYTGWQYAAIPFVLKKECCPIAVTVRLGYTGNIGSCYFTNPRLVAVDGICTTNTYRTDATPIDSIKVFGEDKSIKLMTAKMDGVLTTTDFVDDKSDIVRTTVTDKSGCSFSTDYQYDSKHNLVKMQDYRGLVIEYTYNDYGRELTRKTYHMDNPDAYMFSEYTYQDGSFIESERDPRYAYNGQELKTTYEYDTSRNLLLKQTAVSGQEYSYTYDDKTDDLLSLSSTVSNKRNENQFFYTCGYLTRVAHNGFQFDFSFDELGRSKAITVGDDAASVALLTMRYEKDGVNDITETTFASGEKNTVTTDIFGNPPVSTYTDRDGNTRTVSHATYDLAGKVTQLVDNERGVYYNYTYDAKGNVTKVVEIEAVSGYVLSTNTFVFDANERLTAKKYGAVNHTYRPVYEKDENGQVYPDNEVLGITLDGKFTDRVEKDGLRRTQHKTFSHGSRTLFEESYGYLATLKGGQTIETEIVASVSSHVYGNDASAETLSYTYDKAGNLTIIKRGDALLSKYYYDGLNRLKREDNHATGKTYTWDYDVGGNILFKKEYVLRTDVNLGACLDTKTYTYKTEGWRDCLESYNGLSCVYDTMGNPTVYLGHSLEWTKVRRLSKFDGNTFKYGASGIRYQKNDTVYTLDGNKILQESDGVRTLTYYHGGSGIVGFAYNGTDYYFRKNLQGDVTEIYTSAGLKVASYAYDAWGKVLAVNNDTDDSIGDINPIRYRSYYYDVETGLYYLNSRYYDPEVGRFINADTTDVLENAMYDINGLNLYAYCDNNPVAGRDDEGDASFWKKLAVAVAVVTVVAVTAAVICATAGTATPLCAIATTFVSAGKGAIIGAAVGAASGAVVGGVQGAVEGYQESGTWEGTLRGMERGAYKGAIEGAKEGFISGFVSGGISGAAASMAGNPMFCFVAGTAVLTAAGKKAIETVQIGDVIPCVDHITGETAEKRVVSTTVNKVNRLIELDIDGEVIRCTETHPFQVKGKGWVDAAELVPNDAVYTKDWGTATVKSVSLLELDEPVEVFNFEVEDCHTYFVGEQCILVHNSCQVHGKSHGSATHKAAIDSKAKSMQSSGEYTDIWLNKQLNTAGMKGTQRPDIIAKRLDGTFEYIEYASKSQAKGSHGYKMLIEKMDIIDDANGFVGKLFNWGAY